MNSSFKALRIIETSKIWVVRLINCIYIVLHNIKQIKKSVTINQDTKLQHYKTKI